MEAGGSARRNAMPTTNLTTRERQIIELIGTGSSTKDIARALEISVWTVASHRKRICAKLGVHSTAELVAVSSADSAVGTSGRSADRCQLSVDLATAAGRVQLTYSGRLRRTPGKATVRIGRTLFYF
jgi:DNA-binding CsgD family transcriptional regulator